MNILGYIQTKERIILDLVDVLPSDYDEHHARLFDESRPVQYIRVIDRWYGTSGLLDIEDIRLIFKIKGL
jgi:hypothetical protein